MHDTGGGVGREGSKLKNLFDYITDNAVKWAPMDDVFDVAVFPAKKGETKSKQYPIRSGGYKAFRAQLLINFPDEEIAIDKVIQLMRKSDLATGILLISRVLPVSLGKLLWSLCRSIVAPYYERTTKQALEALTDNKELIAVLSYLWGDYGNQPSAGAFGVHAMVLKHFVQGSYYPFGGPSTIPKAMIRVIERNGGKVLVRAPVTEVLINPNSGHVEGIIVKNKYKLLCSTVISSIGVPLTCTKLLSEQHQEKLRPLLQQVSDPAVASNISLTSLFVGLEGDAKQLGLPNRNYWVYVYSIFHLFNFFFSFSLYFYIYILCDGMNV